MKQSRLLRLLVLLAFLPLFAPGAQAQTQPDTTVTWHIVTRDDNEYFGRILERNDKTIVLKTETIGTITLQTANISRMEAVEAKRMINGVAWTENSQSTRYFWAPNGYGLRKGEGYYQNIWVFFNQASVGITDNISMGLGTIPLFLFTESTPVWLTPKVSVPVVKDKFNLGGGALLGTVLGNGNFSEGENEFYGILFAVGTVGSRDRNVNLGVGYAFAGGEIAQKPLISLGGMYRVGRKAYLLTENYFVPGEIGAFSLIGARTVWTRVSLDYGLFIPLIPGEGFTFALPWLGLSVPFGKKAMPDKL